MITEIEITGTSLGLQAFNVNCEVLPLVFAKLSALGPFQVEAKEPGFHDLEQIDGLIRGYYSAVEPFEVEEVVGGITTKTLHHRIISCEFMLFPNVLFAWGKTGPMKPMTFEISSATGYAVTKADIDRPKMIGFEDRLSKIQSVSIENPKDNEIRKVTLAGSIENYSDNDAIDLRGHQLTKVAGLLDTPTGPMKVTLTDSGSIRLGVKRGFILTTDALLWLWGLINEAGNPARHFQKLIDDPKSGLDSISITTNTGKDGPKTVTIARKGKRKAGPQAGPQDHDAA